MVHDSLYPAAGVKVLPCPRRLHVAGLTPSQKQAMRRVSLNGAVLGAKPVGGPVSLGISSTARCSAPLAKHMERPRQGKMTRSLCHLARADGPNMELAAVQKRQRRAQIKQERDSRHCLRRALMAARHGDHSLYRRMYQRLRRLGASQQLQELHQFVAGYAG